MKDRRLAVVAWPAQPATGGAVSGAAGPVSSLAVWRADDDVLLQRLEDEVLLEQLVADLVGGRPPISPHPRAAGLFGALRSLPGGLSAVERAAAGDRAALVALVRPAKLPVAEPLLLHHLALLEAGVADARAALGGDPVDARVRSLAAWFALGQSGRYLEDLARVVAGGAVADGEASRIAQEAPRAVLGKLGDAARVGARERTREASAALWALARVDEACDRAGLAPTPREAYVRRAGALRAAAVDEALAPLHEALGESKARGAAASEAPAIFARAAEAWRWAGEDEAVERFAVQEIAPIAWEVYRGGRWSELRSLLAPILPLVDRLAGRIEADPTHIAYAAPCAQALVFQADAEERPELSQALAERAVRICPTHRNGRLTLANALCDEAIRMLDGWPPRRDAVAVAAARIERAATLFPDCKRLVRAREALAKVRGRGGAS